MELLMVGGGARLGGARRCRGGGVRAEQRAGHRVNRDMFMRGHKQLIVRTQGLQGIHQEQGVDREGEVGVVRPPCQPSAHVGHLQLDHRPAL